MTPYGYQGYGYSQQQNPYLQNNYSPYGQQMQYNNNINNNPIQAQNGLNEVIQGAIVDSIDVVKSKNCNLDGSCAYYPASDKSAIYTKQLNPATGAGVLLTYKLEQPDVAPQASIEQQVASLLSTFKADISNELAEIKNLVLESATTPTITEDKQNNNSNTTFINRGHNSNGGNSK